MMQELSEIPNVLFEPEPPLSVLLVEDNDEDAEFLQITLSRVKNPPFHLERTGTLKETLERLDRGGADLVILDLSLPDCRGFSTFQAVKEKDSRASIVVLTGYNDERLALKALNMGAQDYIVKGNLDTSHLSRSMRFAVERKRAEIALLESEERFRAVIDHALDTITTINDDGTILSFNAAGEKTFGYLSREVIGRNIRILIPEFPLDARGSGLTSALTTGASPSHTHLVEMRGRHKQGHTIYLEISLSQSYQNGRPLLVGVVRDITDRKLSEDKLRKAQDDLVQAAKMAVLGQMSAEISHELNQPLEALQAYVDNIRWLLQEKRYQEVNSNFEAISDMMRRVGKIIRNIKNLASSPTHEIQPVSPQAAMESALSLLQMGSRLEGIEVHRDFPDETAWVMGETVQLEQIFLNLLTNAVDAMQDSPQRCLHLTIEPTEDDVQIIIRDTGPGIKESVLPRIFEPFFTTKDMKKGLGLGLAITASIIRELGGKIQTVPHPQGGAQFTLTFPKTYPQAIPEYNG